MTTTTEATSSFTNFAITPGFALGLIVGLLALAQLFWNGAATKRARVASGRLYHPELSTKQVDGEYMAEEAS